MSSLDKIKEHLANKILKFEEKSSRRIYIDLNPDDIYEAVKFIFGDVHCRFSTGTGMDTPYGIEILYHFSDDESGQVISLRTIITDRKKPEIKSIAPLFKGAEWMEREIWELVGVNFIGHPNLTHLLLMDEWPEGKFPLRHDHE